MTGSVVLIANPIAGGGRGRSAAGIASEAIASAGIANHVVFPQSAEDTINCTREAVSDGAAAVIACGGDGTVHGVVQALVHSATALGIVPCGSGDDIAIGLGFPADVRAASTYVAEAISSGRTFDSDVGRVTGPDGGSRYFLGILSTGFDSAVNERANTMTRLGGQRYNVAMVRELASFRPATFELTLDDEVISGEAMLVAVGNGTRYGRGMRVCPGAQVDDGLLDVTWLSAMTKPAFLRAFPSVFKGKHVSHPSVRTFRGRRLVIDAADHIAYADGERVGPLPVFVETAPSALRVLTG